ncbi:MAG: peptidoglycan-binding protein [Terriglobales bacterium]
MPTQHTVAQGECLSSIAAQAGIPWKTIWNHPDNAELRQKRKDPNVLYPDDIITIPDNVLRQVSCATDASHKFVKSADLTHIKLRLLLDDQPRAGVKYELQVAGQSIKGTTDGGGYLQADIPPDAQSGVLLVGDGNAQDVFEIDFGTLDPIDTDSGVRGRLDALGYDVDDDFQAAVKAFQTKEKLDPTGNVDNALRAKLKEIFGQ